MLDYAFNVLLIEILEDYSQVLERKEKKSDRKITVPEWKLNTHLQRFAQRFMPSQTLMGLLKAHPQHRGKAMTDFKPLMTQALQ